MRYVSIDLSLDNYLQQPQVFGGYAGEHNETVLQVALPQRMIGVEYSDYRFSFQTSEDNEILVPISKLDNNVVSCHLTEQLTIAGKLLFNVVARKLNSGSVSLTSKTNMVALYIGDSPDGNSILPDPNGYKDEMLEMIDARIAKALEGIQNGEGGTIVVDQIYNPKSNNAQSGKAVAEAIENVSDELDNKINGLSSTYVTTEQMNARLQSYAVIDGLNWYLQSSFKKKLDLWQPTVAYYEGDVVAALVNYQGVIQFVLMQCLEIHPPQDPNVVEGEIIFPTEDELKYWHILFSSASNVELGDIDAALDRIIEIQNQLLGGDGA